MKNLIISLVACLLLVSCGKNQKGLYIDGQESGGTGQGSDSVVNTITTSNPEDGVIQAQFGPVRGFYITANWPTLGFNAYFTDEYGWVYGHGSLDDYGAMQSLDPSSGQMNYYISSDPGDAGEQWSSMVLVLEMHPDGSVNVPGSFTVQGRATKSISGSWTDQVGVVHTQTFYNGLLTSWTTNGTEIEVIEPSE